MAKHCTDYPIRFVSYFRHSWNKIEEKILTWRFNYLIDSANVHALRHHSWRRRRGVESVQTSVTLFLIKTFLIIIATKEDLRNNRKWSDVFWKTWRLISWLGMIRERSLERNLIHPIATFSHWRCMSAILVAWIHLRVCT